MPAARAGPRDRGRIGSRRPALRLVWRAGGRGHPVVAVLAFDTDNTLAVARSRPATGSYPALTAAHPQAHLFERELWEQHALRPEGHPWLKPVRASAGDAPALRDFFASTAAKSTRSRSGRCTPESSSRDISAFSAPARRCFISKSAWVPASRHRARAGRRPASRHPEPDRGDRRRLDDRPRDRVCHGPGGARGGGSAAARPVVAAGGARTRAPGQSHGRPGGVGRRRRLSPTSSACGQIRGDFLNLTALLCGNRLAGGWCARAAAASTWSRSASPSCSAAWSPPWRRWSRRRLGCGMPPRSGRASKASAGVCPAGRGARPGGSGGAGLRAGPRCALRPSRPVGHRPPRCRSPSGPAATSSPAPACAGSNCNAPASCCGSSSRPCPGSPFASEAARPRPDTLAVALVEGWRGEICHVALSGADGRLRNYKIVDPSFHNWIGLALALRGQAISDFPICNRVSTSPIAASIFEAATAAPCLSSIPSPIA